MNKCSTWNKFWDELFDEALAIFANEMRQISLTKGFAALVDDEDFETVSRRKWYALKVKNTVYGCSRPSLGNRRYGSLLMHRFVMRINGLDKDGSIDHRNGNGLDNRKANLRIGTHSQNCQNQKLHCDSSTGVKGVTWDKRRNKFVAQIQVDGRHIFLGRFTQKQEAAEAYKVAALNLFGEYANSS